MKKHILVRNASIFDAYTGKFGPKTDILVVDGIVSKIEPGIQAQPCWEVVEGNDLRVSAGWTDAHTHIEGFDPFLTYPSIGCTAVHDAGGLGANDYHVMHEVIARLPFHVTSYLYVGCWGIARGDYDELVTLENLKPEPFLEVASQYKGEIIGAKIRIDPRVNSDTKKTLRQAKELAVKAELPLAVHPSRCTDSLEEILDVLGDGDVYTHVYSSVAPSLFDENGKIKQCVWDAEKRGVNFDIGHGSNNFSYDIVRRAFAQDFAACNISTDYHAGNFKRPGMDLAGVMTKTIHAGMSVEEALKRVIVAPVKMLGLKNKQTTIEIGKPADMTLFQVLDEPILLPDSIKVEELCEKQIRSVATVIGATVHRSKPLGFGGDNYWSVLGSAKP